MARAFKENQTLTGASGGKWGAGGGAAFQPEGTARAKMWRWEGAEFSQGTVSCCWLMQWRSEWEGLTATLRSDFQGPCPEKGCELQRGAIWQSPWFLWGQGQRGFLQARRLLKGPGRV